MTKRTKNRPVILGRKWRKDLDKRFAELPRNVESEREEITRLLFYSMDFTDTLIATLSSFGYHITFDGSSFRPEVEVSLLHTDKDFYLKIQGMFDTFEFTDSDQAELWLLRRAETAHFMEVPLIEHYLLSLVVMIRTAKYRSEVAN